MYLHREAICVPQLNLQHSVSKITFSKSVLLSKPLLFCMTCWLISKSRAVEKATTGETNSGRLANIGSLRWVCITQEEQMDSHGVFLSWWGQFSFSTSKELIVMS